MTKDNLNPEKLTAARIEVYSRWYAAIVEDVITEFGPMTLVIESGSIPYVVALYNRMANRMANQPEDK